ncbi:hypothetical protein E1140_02035 [Fulvivirga lutimaris]|nr:hypothetical protein [Fulvivirga lutimaris]
MDDLQNEELVKITLSKNEATQILRWEKPHEFEFQGRMYDVVRKSQTDNEVTYWCWPDSDESYLNQLLSNIINKTSNNKRSEKSDQLISFLKSIYLVSKAESLNVFSHQKIIYYYQTSGYTSQKFKPSTPPPDSKYLT